MSGLPKQSRIPRLLKSPFFHFILLGGLLFWANGALRSLDASPDSPSGRFIAIDDNRIREMETTFAEQVGRPPRPAELARMIDSEVEEEIFFREAIARGLLDRDPGVHTRLIQKMLFLEGQAETTDRKILLDRAIELGLHQDDLVVRRILVQKIKLLGSALRQDQHPSPEDLAAAYQAQKEALRTPERRSLVQIFFSSDRRGAGAIDQANQVLRELGELPTGSKGAIARGDPFPLGHRLENRSALDLDRVFGAGFGQSAFALPTNAWSTPIPSAYGVHLVRIDRVEAGDIPPLERVSDRLRLQIEEVRRNENLQALASDLRTRYQILLPTSVQDGTDARAFSPPPNRPLSAQEPG